MLPDQRFFDQLKHDFLNQGVIRLKKLTDVQLDASKNEFLNDADGKILIYAQSIAVEKPIIVTGETRSPNDKKEIKKIPINCDSLNIDCCDLPTLLSNHYNLEFTFK